LGVSLLLQVEQSSLKVPAAKKLTAALKDCQERFK
jgi:hypothetical protein